MADLITPKGRHSGKLLTAERLRELLDYDAETGVFRWRPGLGRSNRYEGAEAGAVCASGGIVIRVDLRMYHASRLAWLYAYGEWPVGLVDHRDRDRANNRLSNLRDATRSQNTCNARAPRRNTSGHKGVNFVKATGKWRAVIGHLGRYHFLGGFVSKDEAIAAYRSAADRLHGAFACFSPAQVKG